MIDGKVYPSKAAIREDYKREGYVEVGDLPRSVRPEDVTYRIESSRTDAMVPGIKKVFSYANATHLREHYRRMGVQEAPVPPSQIIEDNRAFRGGWGWRWPLIEELEEDFAKNGPLPPNSARALPGGFVLRSGSVLVG
jgi:hypothetical protein